MPIQAQLVKQLHRLLPSSWNEVDLQPARCQVSRCVVHHGGPGKDLRSGAAHRGSDLKLAPAMLCQLEGRRQHLSQRGRKAWMELEHNLHPLCRIMSMKAVDSMEDPAQEACQHLLHNVSQVVVVRVPHIHCPAM